METPTPGNARTLDDEAARLLAPDRYAVSRSWLLRVLADLGSLMTSAGAQPELRGGQWVGIRIRSLPTATGIGALGLQPGDLLTAINGRALDSVDALLGLLTALPSAHHVVISLERAGRPRSLAYEIR